MSKERRIKQKVRLQQLDRIKAWEDQRDSMKYRPHPLAVAVNRVNQDLRNGRWKHLNK